LANTITKVLVELLARYQCLWGKKEKKKKKKKEKGKRRKGRSQPHKFNMAYNHTSKQLAEHFAELWQCVL